MEQSVRWLASYLGECKDNPGSHAKPYHFTLLIYLTAWSLTAVAGTKASQAAASGLQVFWLLGS